MVTALVASKLLLPADLPPREEAGRDAPPASAASASASHARTSPSACAFCLLLRAPQHACNDRHELTATALQLPVLIVTAPATACLHPTAVVPSAEGLAALEAQRQRVRGVKAEVNEIKADRSFMRASKAFNKQARRDSLGRGGAGQGGARRGEAGRGSGLLWLRARLVMAKWLLLL